MTAQVSHLGQFPCSIETSKALNETGKHGLPPVCPRSLVNLLSLLPAQLSPLADVQSNVSYEVQRKRLLSLLARLASFIPHHGTFIFICFLLFLCMRLVVFDLNLAMARAVRCARAGAPLFMFRAQT